MAPIFGTFNQLTKLCNTAVVRPFKEIVCSIDEATLWLSEQERKLWVYLLSDADIYARPTLTFKKEVT
jgi:hypothetical protein